MELYPTEALAQFEVDTALQSGERKVVHIAGPYAPATIWPTKTYICAYLVVTLHAAAKSRDKLMAMENLEWMMTLAHRKPELHV